MHHDHSRPAALVQVGQAVAVNLEEARRERIFGELAGSGHQSIPSMSELMPEPMPSRAAR